MKRVIIKTLCDSCGGTGLYSGFAEPKGVAVICKVCGGTGCELISYIPFKKQKRKRNIHTVLLDDGFWFTRTSGEKIPEISAKEFYKQMERGNKNEKRTTKQTI